MREIELYGKYAVGDAKYALVDDDDYAALNQHRWFVALRGERRYAARTAYDGMAQATIFMHRDPWFEVPENTDVHHVNGNGLDNQKENRECLSRREHSMIRPKTGGTSIYRGVTWVARRDKWQMNIRIAGRRLYLRYFDSEEEAADAYDRAAIAHYGIDATTNASLGLCETVYVG